MKNLKVLSFFVVYFFVVSGFTNDPEIRKELYNYEIEEVDNNLPVKEAERVWNLIYEGSENPLKVIKRESGNGAVYIVNSKFFEVCYMASSDGFGARNVKKAWSSVPSQINSVVLNADEMKRQQILTPSKVDDEKALGLIASYLPALINDQYLHLIN